MIGFIEVTLFIACMIIFPVLAVVFMYRSVKLRACRTINLVLSAICICFSVFYCYESQESHGQFENRISMTEAKDLSDQDIVKKLLHQKFTFSEKQRLFSKNRILDYRINAIRPAANYSENDKYFSVSYSVKTLNSYWNHGNGHEEGLWIVDKSEYYQLITHDDAFELKFIGGL